MTIIALTCVLILSVVLIIQYVVRSSVTDYLYSDMDEVPVSPIAIVFGAGVWPGGRLSDVLADRVDTAVDLYHAGTIGKILMTGDNRFEWYNEPAAMGQYAMSRGVPEEAIVYDYAGRRTYDSCYRGVHIFGIDRAILVTQEYHQYRAVYTCRQLGMDAVGVNAYSRPYVRARQFALREVPAQVLAWWETNFRHPVPVMGDPIPISFGR